MLDSLRELVRPFYLRNVYFPLFPKRKPPYFITCWNYPEARLEPDHDKPVVVFLPMNDWHTRIQRTQHLARALSRRGYCCVYLNPHLGREFPSRFLARKGYLLTSLDDDLYELHVHLPREPVFHHGCLTESESVQIARAVTETMTSFGNPPVVQVLAFPVWLQAARLLRERHGGRILYDCHDYLPGFPNIAKSILDLEPDTFRSSDLTLCSSENLMDRAKSFAPKSSTVLLRNATSRVFLEIPRAPSPRVNIGYIGALDSWFDVPSIRAAATAHPEWRFQLIGRVENDRIRSLRQFPNIEFAGEIPFAALGPVLSGFTVATIPFVLSRLIAATDPIKAYEYLAAGLPVVSANLGELNRFGDLIFRYHEPADFVHQLEKALATDSPALTLQRRAAAARETWDQRADLLASTLASLV